MKRNPPTLSPQVKERPILMHARSIAGILAGRKTQTRRIIKPQPERAAKIAALGDGWLLERWERQEREFGNFGRAERIHCPYGKPGEHLWIKEAWLPRNSGTLYKADHDAVEAAGVAGMYSDKGQWKPSMFMPRWASRLTLEITDIRVEKVQDISYADCKAEGIRIEDLPPDSDNFHPPGSYGYISGKHPKGTDPVWPKPQQAFGELWDDTNGKNSWEANPFVWVISFRRLL